MTQLLKSLYSISLALAVLALGLVAAVTYPVSCAIVLFLAAFYELSKRSEKGEQR